MKSSPHSLIPILAGIAIAIVMWRYKAGSRPRRVLAEMEKLLLGAGGYVAFCVIVVSLWPSSSNGRWDAPILGHYHMYLITTGSAAIYDSSVPGVYDQGVLLLPGHREIVFGAHSIEVRPPLIFGIATPDDFSNPWRPGNRMPVDRWLFFQLDTRTGTRTDFGSYDALAAAAGKLGGPLRLQSVDAIFSRSRRTPSHAEQIALALPLLIPFLLVRNLVWKP